jgi:hypothetical protein
MTNIRSKSTSLETEEVPKCKVLEVGIDGYAECLRSGPNTCSYALPFGYAFLCHHPRLPEIVEQSRRAVLTPREDRNPK